MQSFINSNMSIVPATSEVVIPEEMDSTNAGFIDSNLPVNPSIGDEIKKEDHKIMKFADSDTQSEDKSNSVIPLPNTEKILNDVNDISMQKDPLATNSQVNKCNQLDVNQISNNKALSKNNEDKINCQTENAATQNESNMVVTCIVDKSITSSDITQTIIVNSVINESTHLIAEKASFTNILPQVNENHNVVINEDNCNSTNNHNGGYVDVEISGLSNCDEDEYFTCPLRPMSPQSQLRDLCKRGDADQLEKFLADMCNLEDTTNCNINEDDTQNRLTCTKSIDKSKVKISTNYNVKI